MNFHWFFLSLLFVSSTLVAQSNSEWAVVASTLGREGKLQDGVYRVVFPRTDMKIMIGQIQVEPAAGLSSWMAFRKEGTGAVVDGDLVLASDEVNTVIAELQNGGFEITGIHNHLLGEAPQVIYLHFFANGDLRKEVMTLKTTLVKTKTPMNAAAKAEAPAFVHREIVERILGKAGTLNGPALAFGFPRPHPIKMHNVVLPPAMGMATAISFQTTPGGVAATGDFVLRESEVNPVVQALRKHKITVTAMHNHLLDDEPRMTFVHFWAEGDAEAVARGLKDALDISTR